MLASYEHIKERLFTIPKFYRFFMNCLFCKIIKREIPAQIVKETDEILAFQDIHPQAPVHLLIIPKKHLSTLNDATPEDTLLLGALLQTARELASERGIAPSGYRTVINCNQEGGQTVYHLHVHLLGKKQLGGSMVG